MFKGFWLDMLCKYKRHSSYAKWSANFPSLCIVIIYCYLLHQFKVQIHSKSLA